MTAYHLAEPATPPREATVAAWVDRETADRLAQLAKESDSSISREVRAAIRQYLATREALTAA
jgi:predicted transcriptional regulator